MTRGTLQGTAAGATIIARVSPRQQHGAAERCGGGGRRCSGRAATIKKRAAGEQTFCSGGCSADALCFARALARSRLFIAARCKIKKRPQQQQATAEAVICKSADGTSTERTAAINFNANMYFYCWRAQRAACMFFILMKIHVQT